MTKLAVSSSAQVPQIIKTKSKAKALAKIIGKDIFKLGKASVLIPFKVAIEVIALPFKYWPDIIMFGLFAPTIILPLFWLGGPIHPPNGYNSPRQKFYRWKANVVQNYLASVNERLEKELK